MFLITVTGFDATGDGQVEIVVGSPWEAIVWLMPARHDGSSLSVTEAIGSFETPYDRQALGSWFGYASAGGDLDGDGHVDLAISTPSYGEVGHLGAEELRVFRGPHAGHRFGASADFTHASEPRTVVAPGERLAVCRGRVIFSAGLDPDEDGQLDWALVRTELAGGALASRARCADLDR